MRFFHSISIWSLWLKIAPLYRKLGGNLFTGPLPSEIGLLNALSFNMWVFTLRPLGCLIACRDVGNNSLSGLLPSELGMLTSLNNLRVHFSFIYLGLLMFCDTGIRKKMCSQDLCRVKSGDWLFCKLCKLLSHSHSTPWLNPSHSDLSDNQLSGTIPSQVGFLTICTALFVVFFCQSPSWAVSQGFEPQPILGHPA